MKHFLIALLVLACSASSAYAQDVHAPAKTTDLVIGTGKTTATATCTQPTDDCASGTASSVEIRRSTAPITEANWCSATVVYSGQWLSCMDLTGATHTCNTAYYWALKSIDDAGNYSPLSNVDQESTDCCIGCPEEICSTLLWRDRGGSLAPRPVLVGGTRLDGNVG